MNARDGFMFELGRIGAGVLFFIAVAIVCVVVVVIAAPKGPPK